MSGPTTLTPEEILDSQRREDLDHVREQGKAQFEKEVSERVDKLRDSVKDIKGDLMGPGSYIYIQVHIALRAVLIKRGLMDRRLDARVCNHTSDTKLF